MTPDDFLNTSDLANFESEVREISPFFFSVKPRFKTKKRRSWRLRTVWRSCSNTFFFRFQVKIGEQFFKSAFPPPDFFRKHSGFKQRFPGIYLSSGRFSWLPRIHQNNRSNKIRWRLWWPQILHATWRWHPRFRAENVFCWSKIGLPCIRMRRKEENIILVIWANIITTTSEWLGESNYSNLPSNTLPETDIAPNHF